MHATSEKGSALTKDTARTKHLQLLTNFCRTVVRSDDDLLQLAIEEYDQFLREGQHNQAA